MNTTKSVLEDNTIELLITIPWLTIAAMYETVVEDAVKNAEVDGFRKGKAPRNIVEPKLDTSKLFEEVVKKLVPKAYSDAATEMKIHPVITPKIELKEATEGKDWVIRALTCERPKAVIGEYKKAIQELKAQKATKIWTPGTTEKPEEKDAKKGPTLDEILKVVYEKVTITIPEILIESEVNRLLSELIDQTKRLGMTVEQYLGATGRNAEGIRKEYSEQAKRTVTLEIALEDIADGEGILVSDDELDAVIKSSKTEGEKKSLENQRYYLATVLRRQKTLDFLAAL